MTSHQRWAVSLVRRPKSSIAGLLVLTALSLPVVAHAQGGPGGNPERRAIIQSLSEEERQKFFAMSREEKRAFMQEQLKKKAAASGSAPKPAAQGTSPQRAQGARPGGNRPGGGRGGRRPPPLVELADVTKEPLIQIIPITGRIVSSQKSAIAARIKGPVSKVLVQVGDSVKSGDTLAELDVDRLKLEADLKSAEVIQARAKWNSAKAEVDLLKLELKRLQQLRRSAAFSQARYDDKRQEIVKAEASVEETAAALRRARSARDLARIDVRDAVVLAPFDGVVLIRHVSPGVYVNPGSSIVTLLDAENLEIEADVPSSRLSGVPVGSVIKVRIQDQKIEAAVRAIIPDENPLARTQAVRLSPDLDKTNLSVVSNQSVVLEVPQGAGTEVIAVPKDALVNRQSGAIVFVFERGQVRPANVVIGKAFAGKFEVVSGLTPGQKVVVTGNELLRPGQRVRTRGGRPGGRPGARPGGRPGGGSEGRPSARAPGAGASGPGGGPGGLSREQRRAIVQSLSDEERQKFFNMSREEKQQFFRQRASKGGA